MLSPDKPPAPARPRSRTSGFTGPQIAILCAALILIISVPIWTHPLPPLSDYINHLARMHVIATAGKNTPLDAFYQINWQVIPNLVMDLLVPLLARVMNIYFAGQVFMVAMFALIISGTLTLNRVLVGRWTVVPLFALPLLYNNVFLVGLMNYLFGIGVAAWGLVAWIALRERFWPLRYAVSTAFVALLFFCHLSSLGIYGVGILAYELYRLWDQRAEPWPWRVAEFVAGGLPFLAAVPLLFMSPTLQLVSAIFWEQRGKMDGLMYIFTDYSDIVAFALIGIFTASIVWGVRHRILRFHPLIWWLIGVGSAVYIALPRVMFETYMADQRVPIGVAFMLFACADLELRRRLLRRGIMAVLLLLVAARLIEIDRNWSDLSDSIGQFRSSVRRIQPGAKVFVSYADRSSLGDDVRDLGLVHAACIAIIERSALVTTAFTVVGKQVMHVREAYRDFVDTQDGTPPSTAQLVLAAEHPQNWMPGFWKNWTQFDYLYVIFTEDEAPNPDPARLRLVADGDRFQLYRILKPQ
jgi:hypothetical protein